MEMYYVLENSWLSRLDSSNGAFTGMLTASAKALAVLESKSQ